MKQEHNNPGWIEVNWLLIKGIFTWNFKPLWNAIERQERADLRWATEYYQRTSCSSIKMAMRLLWLARATFWATMIVFVYLAGWTDVFMPIAEYIYSR